MPVRQRKLNKKQALESDARAWLRGEEENVLFRGKPTEELSRLWDEYGEKEKFHWDESMRFQLPQPKR
jgi:hypothetical protein